jgi:hypothetical protein
MRRRISLKPRVATVRPDPAVQAAKGALRSHTSNSLGARASCAPAIQVSHWPAVAQAAGQSRRRGRTVIIVDAGGRNAQRSLHIGGHIVHAFMYGHSCPPDGGLWVRAKGNLMHLERIDVRFFRSFNFDFEMKARPEKTPEDWEDTEEGWFPFVRIALDESITAVVGANESGKSQLLTAIEAALTGRPIQRADFCRYSELYSVQAGKYRFPEFGAILRLKNAEDVSALPARFNVGIGEKFALYRTSPTEAYVVTGGTSHHLDPAELAQLQARLPNVFKLETAVALPDSVSIRELAGLGRSRFADRKQRTAFLDVLADGSFDDPGTFGQSLYPHYSSAGD